MCAMISGQFIGSNDGKPPNPYKENLVSLIVKITSENGNTGHFAAEKLFANYTHCSRKYDWKLFCLRINCIQNI